MLPLLVWSFFHANSQTNTLPLPSSSDITKSAYPEKNGHYREFPNSGLSTEMICRSLRAYDVVPEYFEFSSEILPSKIHNTITSQEKAGIIKRIYIFNILLVDCL